MCKMELPRVSRVRTLRYRIQFFILLSPLIVCAQTQENWEIAVVTDKKLELLDSNGSLVGSTINLTAELKTLAFDNARSQFIVSDRVSNNDSIFSVLLTSLQKTPPVNETKVTPLVTNLPDDVQGLAVDPIEDVVYWTDQDRQTINYLKLNDTESKPQVLIHFNNSHYRLQGITIDVCGRYIYWTNSFFPRSTIERAFLNGSNREVIIDTDLKLPTGIAIDYRTNRLYWADMGEGIYNKIESSRLDGKEREMVYNGTHTKPFGIAVDESSVYWTDVVNNAIWRAETDLPRQNNNLTQKDEIDQEPQPGCSHWSPQNCSSSSILIELQQNKENEQLSDNAEVPKRASLKMENRKTEHVEIEGRRLVDVNSLFEKIKEISNHGPFGCSFEHMNIVSERRQGLLSTLKLQCGMCNVIKYLPLTNEATGKKLNESITLAMVSTGIGYSTLEELLTFVDVPFMNFRTYQKYNEKVSEVIHSKAWEIMRQAAEEGAQLARSFGEIDKTTKLPLITVVADGAWSKRSYNVNYTASSGVACIIGARTKKLLFLGVRNKYCSYCSFAEHLSLSPIPPHKCVKNWKGSSSAMESDIICEGFKRSVEMYGLIYNKLVGDGDSSVYRKLIELRPYGMMIVEKIECRNHLLRNFCSKIREICQKKRSASTNAPVSPNLRKILHQKIGKLRYCISSAIKYRIKEETDHLKKVLDLVDDLKNIPFHVLGEHDNCKSYYRCSTPKEKNYVLLASSCGMLQDLQIAFNRLMQHAGSLIHNMDNNIAEQYNSVVCKFVGGKRVDFAKKAQYQTRCEAASISYNLGPSDYHLTISRAVLNNTPKKLMTTYAQNISKKRKHKAVRKKLFSKKNEGKCLDKDYGPEANPEPDLNKDLFEIKKHAFLRDLQKSEFEIKELEITTRGQTRNPKWHQERSCRLTASNFGTICKMRPNTSCINTIKALLYTKFMGNSHTKYGAEMEQFALKALEKQIRKKISGCGIFVDSKYCFLAASPDGIVYDDDAIVEIKCPSVAAKTTITQAIELKKITFGTITANGFKLKRNHNYFYQVQGQLHITRKNWCYFTIWSPLEFLIERIERDDSFWEKNMETKLITFYEKCLLPELIDPRYTRNLPIRNPSRQ